MALVEENDGGQAMIDMLLKRAREELEPPQQNRLEALLELQKKQSALQHEFLKEIEQIELKYQKLFQPLYSERSNLIKGAASGEGTAADASSTPGAGDAPIPQFWLRVFDAHLDIRELITERDREVLQYLTDVKAEQLAPPSKGFRLQFFFSPNPFFSNDVLEKTYYLADEQQQVDDMVLDHAEGTPISWQPGKDTTTETYMSKPKGKGRGPPKLLSRKCPSFFDFFSPPQMPEDFEDLEEEQEQELEEAISDDFDQGCTIYRQIFPRAVDWYTGTAVMETFGAAMLGELEGLALDDDDE